MSKFIDSLNLNSIQKDAVEYDGGAQLVFAGAGTGKTRVLTAKIAWLIHDKGMRPGNIFAATFTNKAAGEMKERVSALIGMPCDALWIGTFHSLCVRILRREADLLGYSRNFTIYDSSDQLSLLKNCMKSAMVDENALQPKAVLHHISSYKNKCIKPDELLAQAGSFYEREIATLYTAYQEGLKAADAMDFDDLIGLVVALFKTFPERAVAYQDLFRYILVDEYQDTNGAQFQLVKYLAGAINPVFAVGDDDQSIYGWRGAQVQHILSFEKFFPGTKISKLEQNYRSTTPILMFANAIIAENKERADKQLWTNQHQGDPVFIRAYGDDREEATAITACISLEISSGAQPSEIALLYRTNAQSRLFEDHFRKNNIPYVLVGGTSFYERKEIKDVMAYLKLLVNPKDSVSCQRVLNIPTRGIGAVSQESIARYAQESGCTFSEAILSGAAENVVKGKALKGLQSFRQLYAFLRELQNEKKSPEFILTELLRETAYIDQLVEMQSEEARGRVENINELLNAIAQWQEEHQEGDIAQFLEEITLASDIDSWDGKASVSMMTLHTAKGLEFNSVYVVGVEDGLIPSRQNFDDPQNLEEERRLLYVGATRAKQKLTCSYAESRMRFGAIMPMGISRFMQALPEQLYELIDMTSRFSTLSWKDDFKAPIYATNRGGTSTRTMPVRPSVRTSNDPSHRALPDSFRQAPAPDDFNQTTEQIRMGQRVKHASFGLGKVMNVSGFGPDMRVTILFDDGQRKQMVSKFAKLEVV